jgi:surface antigen
VSNAASYAWGNCTYYVASLLSWIPGNLGNAFQWTTNAQRDGLAVSSMPAVGSAVVYAAGGGYSSFGHVAVVDQVNNDGTFNVEEMNFLGLNQVDTRRSTMADVEGFILAPGNSTGSAILGALGGAVIPNGPQLIGGAAGAVGTGLAGAAGGAFWSGFGTETAAGKGWITSRAVPWVEANVIALAVAAALILLILGSGQPKGGGSPMPPIPIPM